MSRTSKPVLGQHWLPHGPSLAAMAAAAELKPTETVFEIGTGLGYLTDELLKTGARVVSLEYDEAIFEKNRLKYASTDTKRLQLLQGDIRRFNWQLLEPPFKICANIPYYLSANLFRSLIDLPIKPSLAALLLPQAVAIKLTEPVKRTLLAVLVQIHYEVELGQVIAKEMFTPPPKIDSRIAILRHRPAFEDFNEADWRHLISLLKIAFASPRKQLVVNLSHGLQRPKAELAPVLKSAGVDPRQRAEELNNQQWQILARALNSDPA